MDVQRAMEIEREVMRRAMDAGKPSAASDCYISSRVETHVLSTMFEAYQRLKSEGWQDIIYCPKDGTLFWSISAGSTGVHETYYDGIWPKGSWWINDGGDTWPDRLILWKAKEI